jgi:S-adenosylmethionine:tRNA ribosyltransferase-isomerase
LRPGEASATRAAVRTTDFDYDLPPELIAQEPARPRDSARLLVLRGAAPEDLGVLDLPALLEPGDVLVVNDTRVIPARLHAKRGAARIEVLLNRAEGAGRWHALLRNAKRARVGEVLEIEGAEGCTARVVEREDGGGAILDFGPDHAALAAALERAGSIPLPPYIRGGAARSQDAADYQTIFAARPGAVAAPTASLHFTERLLAALDARGVKRATVTLHVGAGTFLPMREDDPRKHRLHAEWGELDEAAAAAINGARRVVCAGTTALRLVESAAREDGGVAPFRGLTDLYILPGFRFRVADVLMTNFHLPKSTLFMLACAFAGEARVKDAYAHAIAARYRFYSYGDSSLLFRA